MSKAQLPAKCGLQNEWTISQQPGHLEIWLLGAFCLEFNFELIYGSRILISGLDQKIVTQNRHFNMDRGQ